MAKLDKAYARYGRAKAGSDRCDRCRWFDAPRACEIVDGVVEAGGWCRFFHEERRKIPDARAYVREMRSRG